MGILAKLEDILRQLDVISIILGILDFVLYYENPFIPINMASNWARWMVAEQNQLFSFLMYCKIAWKLDVSAIQRQIILLWKDFIIRGVWTTMILAVDCYSMERCSDLVFDFFYDLTQDME